MTDKKRRIFEYDNYEDLAKVIDKYDSNNLKEGRQKEQKGIDDHGGLNNLDKTEASKLLSTCCGSGKWLELLLAAAPFKNTMQLIAKAESIWYNDCNAANWLEAFTHHPKIGDVKSLTQKFASTQHLASNEMRCSGKEKHGRGNISA